MKELKILFISVFLVVLVSASSYGANLTYTLLPGSTITPVYGNNPTGETEALTGSFQWYEEDSGNTDLRVFNASYLWFESPSYLLTLNTTPLNDSGTSIFIGSSDTYFMEVVNLVGLPITTGKINSFNVGSYSGPSNRPDILTYSDIVISPVNGGPFYAKVNLTAAIVPEPISSILFITGGVLLAGRRFIRRKV